MSVMIGYIHAGTVRAEFMQSVLGVLNNPETQRLIGGVAEASAGAMVALARDVLTGQFLTSACDWLWCVDTDMVFTPAVLTGLLAAADPGLRPVMSAVCHILDQGQVWPSAYELVLSDGEPDLARLRQVPDGGGGPVRVAATGAACLLIHRGVFDAISEHTGEELWWAQMTIGGATLGEDLSFCLRANAAGIPVYLHTGIAAGHMKAVMLGTVAPLE